MKFIDRFKNIFRKEEKASATAPLIATLYPSGAVWPPRDYENFAKEAYLKNIISFRCIDLISKSVASVPWGLFREDGESRVDVEGTPYNDLLKRSSIDKSWSFFLLEVIAYWALSGNAFIERVSPETGPNKGLPAELHVLRPDRMTINIDKDTGEISGYTYSIGTSSKTWEVDPITGKSDILHMKNFNPLDDLWGAAITESSAREIDTYNSAADYNKCLFDNQASPGMLLFFENNMSDHQFKQLERTLKDKYEGAKNAGKTMILEGARDAKPYSFSPAEMDFIQSKLELSRNICNAYGVPPQLIGIPDSNTYSNYREARFSFWEDTVLYYLRHFKGEINNWLFDTTDIFYDYDISDIPAMEYKNEMKWERAQQADFLTINEKREMVGFETIGEVGDTILQPATMIPLGFEPPTEEEVQDDEDRSIQKLSAIVDEEDAEMLIKGYIERDTRG